MKNCSKIMMGVALSSLLSGCATIHGPDGYRMTSDSEGIAISKVKDITDYTGCLFNGTRPNLPKNDQALPKDRPGEFQYVAFKVESNGNLRRYEVMPGSTAEKNLLAANNDQNFTEWQNILADTSTKFKVMNPSKTPPRPQRRTNWKNTAKPNPNLEKYPNPLNVDLHYFSKISYIVLNNDWTFDGKSSFRVPVGNSKGLPPFSNVTLYNPPSGGTRAGQMISVDYYNGRDLPAGGLNANCLYDYELNMVVTEKYNGVDYKTKIIIDPKNGGDNSPPPLP